MARLQDSKGKAGEGYNRIFGNQQLGRLLSRVQSTMIRSGLELEKILKEVIPLDIQTTLDDLNDPSNLLPDIQVVFKPSRPNPDNPKKSIEADLLIVDNRSRTFALVEIKDGDVFDTKKSDGELASLKSITSWLAQEFAYKTEYFLCAFNQGDKEIIVQGTKRRFSIEHVMTGRELCERIGLDYDTLRENRKIDQRGNLQYFLTELLKISEIKNEILELVQNQEYLDD